jgi:hypothetical protein
MIREVIYKGRDNTIDLQLSSDEGVADLSGVTKVELVDTFGSLGTISSDDFPSAFDWSSGDGVLVLSIADAETITDGVSNMVVNSTHRFNVIVYDSENTNGVDWGFFTAYIR